MNTATAIQYIKVLQDKYGSPELTDDEITTFLDNAQFEYLNRLLPDNQGGETNFELNIDTLSNIQHLIVQVPITATGGTFLVSSVAADANITPDGFHNMVSINVAGSTRTDIPDSSTDYFRFLKKNNIGAFYKNFFKRPATTKKRYSLVSGSVLLYPKADYILNVVVVKNPKTFASGTTLWGDYQMYSIIAIALQLAGVSTRDEELITDIRNTTLQGNK